MKLKKPRVKVKKSSQPKPSSRIVAKVKTKTMPEIQLPDLVGTGEGLMGGTGMGDDFLDLPEIGELTVFGGEVTSGNDMKVTFYNLNLGRSGNDVAMNPDAYESVLQKFVKSGWKKSILGKYYRSSRVLYATTIMIPICTSTVAPSAFGEDLDYGYCWVALYEGKLTHKDPITFRFWGASDDVLTVAVDGEVVLEANWPDSRIASDWASSAGSFPFAVLYCAMRSRTSMQSV